MGKYVRTNAFIGQFEARDLEANNIERLVAQNQNIEERKISVQSR